MVLRMKQFCYKVRVAVDDVMGNGCSLREERCPLAFPGFEVMRTNWGRQIDRKLNKWESNVA